MTDHLFMRLFDNSVEISSPADPRKTFRENSLCNSPTVEYLTRRTRRTSQTTKHSSGLGSFENKENAVLPIRITTCEFPKRPQYKHRFADSPVSSPLFPSVRKLYDGHPSTSTPIRQCDRNTDKVSSVPKLSQVFSISGDREVRSKITGDKDESFKIIGPICSVLTHNFNKLQINDESPLAESSVRTSNGIGRNKVKRSLNLSQTNQSESSSGRNGPIRVFTPMAKANIKSTLEQVENNPDLIGDGTSTFCLPTVPGKHQDLKSITQETLAKVINQEYDHIIEKFVIIDCRYPYEFDGGHIKGAENVYTKQCLVKRFMNTSLQRRANAKRTVLVFHCEFSSERAPKMMRFLRHQDRDYNKDHYPALFYPEVYLLHDGYKQFFLNHKGLCTPQSYRPMLHECYKDELRRFRKETKQWPGEKKSRPLLKTRLGLQTVY